MIEIEPHALGAVLPVKAHAAARRNSLSGEQAGRLRVAVTAAPDQGKANRAIVALLGQALDLRSSQIELLSGQTSGQKRFLVRNLAPAELAERVRRALSDDAGSRPKTR